MINVTKENNQQISLSRSYIALFLAFTVIFGKSDHTSNYKNVSHLYDLNKSIFYSKSLINALYSMKIFKIKRISYLIIPLLIPSILFLPYVHVRHSSFNR